MPANWAIAYDLFLNLPDPELAHHPEYSIRLANTAVWEQTTVYNRLLHYISVTNTATNPTCSSGALTLIKR